MTRTTYEGIIIDDEHKEKIIEKINDEEQYYSVRLLSDDETGGYKSVCNCIELLEKHFMDEGIPKDVYEGCKFRYDKFHKDYSENYKYEIKSTQIVVTYTGNKWRLLKVKREEVMPAKYCFVMSSKTDKFKEYITKLAVREALRKATWF